MAEPSPQRQKNNSEKSMVSHESHFDHIAGCTISGHPPVDELHFIENKDDKNPEKTVDGKSTGCTTHSFFDSFQGCPVGGKSGAEASSPQPRLQRIGKRRDSDGR